MVLQQMRTMAKVRAMVPFEADFNTVFDMTINQVLQQYTALLCYPEMFMQNVEITATDATGSVSLPDDLQHLDPKSIRFKSGSSTLDDGYFLGYYGRFTTGIDGSPSQWSRTGSTLMFNPYTSVTSFDSILLNYWKRPAQLVEDDDEFPIKDLETVVMLETASQCAHYNDKPNATMLSGQLHIQAHQAYIANCAINGRFSKP